MRIAVLSGKGGTGKTFVAVNLAASSNHSTYIDCDVEAPNGRLFFKPREITTTQVTTSLPVFEQNKCNGCRQCVDFCHYNALVYIKEKPMIFPDVCHACGGCLLVCKQNAISEEPKDVGSVEMGTHKGINVVTGILNLGEASAIPVIKEALKQGLSCENKELVVIDCPPGSSCAAMESVSQSDYCVIVVEPTAFGFHNFQMIHELLTLVQKPFGIVINKADTLYSPLEDFCIEQEIAVLARIPYEEYLATLTAAGEIAILHDTEIAKTFSQLLTTLQEEVAS